ncbi:MAG: hypothetical protein VKM34_01800 [Cyanobacteriota bacterium]|nr:hypothetical protein [Cyanobacteriota bacterium]
MNRFSGLLTLLAVAMAHAPGQAQSLPPDVLNKAKSNCLTAVSRKVNKPRSSLKIISARSDSSGATVSIKVPTAQGPWACLTSPKGEVEDVYFNG